MTKKSLLDVVFASEKRMKVVLMLQKGPQEMVTLLRELGTTRAALLPQMRILEDHHLVTDSADVYSLTTIGELVVEQMIPLVGMTEFFDSDIDYWGEHNLDFLPPEHLDTFSGVKKCEIVNPPFEDLYDMHKQFHEYEKTESIYKVTNFLYPDYNTIFTEMMDSGATIYYIVSKELLEKIRKDHCEDFKAFIRTNMFKLYVYKGKLDFLFFTLDDFHILLGLFRNDGNFDNKYVLCSGPESVQWGKSLFEYYLKESDPIQIDDL